MLPYRDSRITKVALVVFFLVVIAYAYYEARGLLFGPSITVSSQTSIVHTQFIDIQGAAERISSLSMNGKAVPVTESGQFDVPYLLSPGYNRIVLDAVDTYGRGRSQTIEVVYIPTSTSSPSTASSTVGMAD